MRITHFIPVLCTAILLAIGTATPSMSEAREFKNHGHKASHYVRKHSQSGHHGHYRHHRKLSRYLGKHYRGHHYGHRHYGKRTRHWRYGYSRPHHGYSGHHGRGGVSFSLRYRD